MVSLPLGGGVAVASTTPIIGGVAALEAAKVKEKVAKK